MVTRADLCPPTEVWLLAAEEQELNKRGLVWNRSSVGQTDTALLSVILSHKFNWNNQSWCPQSLWLVKDVSTCIVWSCVVIQCVLLWKQSTPGLKVNKILELWCKKGSLLSVIVQGWESNLQFYKIAHKRKIVNISSGVWQFAFQSIQGMLDSYSRHRVAVQEVPWHQGPANKFGETSVLANLQNNCK